MPPLGFSSGCRRGSATSQGLDLHHTRHDNKALVLWIIEHIIPPQELQLSFASPLLSNVVDFGLRNSVAID
eukprot:9752393-Karenia_brevis.AAC.1